MWGDSRVDVWFAGMCLSCLASVPLFFVVRRSVRWLYLSFPAVVLCWVAYEAAINAYLSSLVPIRLDVIVVVPMVLFPLIPITVNFVRLRSRREKEKGASKPSGEEIGADSN